MKSKIIILIAISLLLQSCYSYRVIDKNSNFVADKKYKIKLTNKYQEVKLLSSTDSTITIIDNKNIENTIAKTDIKVIRKKQFSVSKTVLLPISIALAVITVIISTSDIPNFNSPK